MTKMFAAKDPPSWSGWLMPLVCFVLVLTLVWAGISQIGRTTAAEQLSTVNQSLQRAAIQCYALEGRYPESLAYLADNYGLILDKERFVYFYRPLGANIRPEISVFYLD